MIKHTSPILFGVSFVPLVTQLPYLLNTWRYSPMDHWNWFFLFCAACFAILFAFLTTVPHDRPGPYSIPVVALALIIILSGAVLNIRAAILMGALLLPWSTAWGLWGWETAWKTLPLLLLALLSITGLPYWLGFLAGAWNLNGTAVQWSLGALFFAAAVVVQFTSFLPRRSSVLFGALILVGLLIAGLPAGNYRRAPGRCLVLASDAFPQFLGREVPPTDADLRFFQNCSIQRWCFASDTDSSSLDLLEVRDIQNIHQIHPASHCIHVNGWDILSEQVFNAAPPNQPPFYVDAIDAQRGGQRCYGWVWYSTPLESTGSFLLFRTLWKHAPDQWRAYQLFTECDSPENGRDRLAQFLFSPSTHIGVPSDENLGI